MPAQKTSLGNPKLHSDGPREHKQFSGLESSSQPLNRKVVHTYQGVAETKDNISPEKAVGPLALKRSQELMVERFREQLLKRGVRGIIGLKKQFKVLDLNENAALEYSEFSKAVRDYRIQVEENDLQGIFAAFDRNGDGTIDFEEFMHMVVGDMNEKRNGWVALAWRKIDVNNAGEVSIDEFRDSFDGSRHPDVKNGVLTEEEAFSEFIDNFEALHAVNCGLKKPSGRIRASDFHEYYRAVGVTIERDNKFQQLVTGVWNVDMAAKDPSAAGSNAPVHLRTARDSWKYDFHRSVFGNRDESPMRHEIEEKKGKGRMEVTNEMPAAGMSCWTNVRRRGLDSNLFNREVKKPAAVMETSHSDKQLLGIFRDRVLARGTRGLVGLRRTFKIFDDDGSKTLSFDEFWKGLMDFRIKAEKEEAQRLF